MQQSIIPKLNERNRQGYEYLKCGADPVYFIDTYVQISHKVRGVIPFSLWGWQADLLDTIHRERAVIVLKSRQLGVSELAVAYALWMIRFQHGKTVLFLSKNAEDAKDLLRRVKLAYNHLPPWLQCGEALSVDTAVIGDNNTERLQIDHLDSQKHPHPSVIRSLPATESAGRSASASLLVLDEWAHQQFDSDIWAAVQPTVSSGGKVLGISTANGMGNTFHSIWTKAEAGENTFVPIFLSWRKHPERDDAWYARTAADLDQPWRLHQEHPEVAAEAFIQTGHPVYASDVLAGHEARIREANLPLVRLEGAPVPVTGHLQVWASPEPNRQYVIGADVAEGLEHGDYSCAVVVDKMTHRQVAELHGRWEPEVFASLLDWLGRLYNKALLAVERNNHGHAVLLALRSLHRYPAVYHHHDPLVPGKERDPRAGWVTSTVTKPIILDVLGKGLRDGSYQPQSLPFLSEASIFAVQKNGSMSAPSGYHDDLVMAHAITAYLCTQALHTATSLISQLRARQERTTLTDR